MSDITLRLVKGSPLTNAEVDDNFSNLNTDKVEGPASATDNALVRFDTTTGKLIQNSAITLSDAGALQNVNEINFDTTPASVVGGAGSLSWNSSEGSLDLVMKGGNVTQHIGEEFFYTARNATGSTINKGVPVYASGVTAGSNRIEITPMIANGSIDELRYIGITSENISTGNNGLVTEVGYVRNIDTTGTPYGQTWAAGDIIYVSATTAGYLSNVQPTAPNLKIVVAIVINVDNNFGVLLVRPTAYPHLTHLSDVNITSPASGNTLIYDAVQGRWENANLTDGTGITITEGAGSITIENSAPMTYPGAGIAVSTGSAWTTSLTAPTGDVVGTSDTQTLTNKTLTAPSISDPVITGAIDEQVYNLTGTVLDPANGTVQYITLASNTTFTESFSEGESMTLMIDDGTAYTITWPTMTWVNNAGAAPTLATTGYTVVALWKVSTTLYGALVGDGA